MGPASSHLVPLESLEPRSSTSPLYVPRDYCPNPTFDRLTDTRNRSRNTMCYHRKAQRQSGIDTEYWLIKLIRIEATKPVHVLVLLDRHCGRYDIGSNSCSDVITLSRLRPALPGFGRAGGRRSGKSGKDGQKARRNIKEDEQRERQKSKEGKDTRIDLPVWLRDCPSRTRRTETECPWRVHVYQANERVDVPGPKKELILNQSGGINRRRRMVAGRRARWGRGKKAIGGKEVEASKSKSNMVRMSQRTRLSEDRARKTAHASQAQLGTHPQREGR